MKSLRVALVALVARAAPDPPWSVEPLARYVPGFDERVTLFLVHDASAYDARLPAPLGEGPHVLPTRCGGQSDGSKARWRRRKRRRATTSRGGGGRARGANVAQ